MDKDILRKVYLEKRKLLTDHEYHKRNELLTDQLIKVFELYAPKHLHCFLPIAKNKEPDTWKFLRHIWESNPEVKVSTAISDLNKPLMHHFSISSKTDFRNNRWGIPEPVKTTAAAIDTLQMVMVPMVIGSKSGHRIGYGKGYYDRFLASCSPQTTFVGVNLGPLLEVDSFSTALDIPLHIMVTPFEVYSNQGK